jgi:hypothetical protein
MLLLQLGLGVTSAVATSSGATGLANVADLGTSLTLIAQKAMMAHEAIVGQPIDPSQLKPFEPIA